MPPSGREKQLLSRSASLADGDGGLGPPPPPHPTLSRSPSAPSGFWGDTDAPGAPRCPHHLTPSCASSVQGTVLLGLVLGRWAMGEALPRAPHVPTYGSLCPEAHAGLV